MTTFVQQFMTSLRSVDGQISFSENDLGEISIVQQVSKPKPKETREFIRWTPKMSQELNILSLLGMRTKDNQKIMGIGRQPLFSKNQKTYNMLRKVLKLVQQAIEKADVSLIKGEHCILFYMLLVQDKIDFMSQKDELENFIKKVELNFPICYLKERIQEI